MITALLASANPLDHVAQWIYQRVNICESDHILPLGPLEIPLTPGGSIALFSNHIIMQIIATLMLILVIPRFAKVRRTGDDIADMTPCGASNAVEAICSYFRTEVVRPVLHDYTDRFIPYIWTAFFYILFVNVLGLLPLEALTRGLVQGVFPNAHHGIGGAATGNLWVTATLAGCTLFMILLNGLRLGGKQFIAHFCPGPLWLAPLLIPVELVGLGAKIFALSVRLFANMVAGHVLLAVLLSFISLSYLAMGAGSASGIGAIVVLVSVAFNLLELFVAFLQAYIFAFLTTIFIGQAIIFHHDHAEEHA